MIDETAAAVKNKTSLDDSLWLQTNRRIDASRRMSQKDHRKGSMRVAGLPYARWPWPERPREEDFCDEYFRPFDEFKTALHQGRLAPVGLFGTKRRRLHPWKEEAL